VVHDVAAMFPSPTHHRVCMGYKTIPVINLILAGVMVSCFPPFRLSALWEI